jgi:hypothetical protein
MYGNWANLIFSKKPVIHDMEAIAEHESIIYEEGSDVPVTPRPLHDDRVMCWIGIGWLYKFVPKVQVRLYTAGDL